MPSQPMRPRLKRPRLKRPRLKRPRRSILYMPGANARAMEKAKGLDCDTIIFDLEDAVAPDTKSEARDQVAAAIAAGGYGYRELIVRANGLDTPWGADDVARFAAMDVDGLLFPKIEAVAQVRDILAALDTGGGSGLPIWLMIETPTGVLDLREVAGCSDRIVALVMGTSDLVNELRARHTATRSNLDYALQHCLLVARALGLEIIDGVHLEFRNLESFEVACQQGRDMGFDGKSLIHPGQVEIANRVFGVGEEAEAHARAVLAAWQEALASGKGVAVVDGQLIENLHVEEAERTIALVEAIGSR